MPTIELSYLKVGDPAPLPDMIIRIHDDAGDWSAIVVEKGMVSGEPSVTLVIKTRDGAVLAETSLLAFLAAARGLQAMAETNFGWTYPP